MLKLTIRKSKNIKTQAELYYPAVAPVSPLDVDHLCSDIEHSTSLSEADVKAVLNAMQYHVVRYLSQGNSIRLGDLGSFRPTVTAKSAGTPEEVNTDLVKGVRVRFTPSGKMARALDRRSIKLSMSDGSGAPMPADTGE